LRGSKGYKRSFSEFRNAAFSRKIVKNGFIIVNVVIVLAVGFLVLVNPTKATTIHASASSVDNQAAINPLDQVSAADIALTVAQMDNLSETTAVANQAQSAAADIAMASTTDNVLSKPQVVTTALKSRADIHSYTAVSGDSVQSLATKFGITSNSIMWSNGLTSNNLSGGTVLTIPPINGIVYTVKAGDTPATLAAKYSANAQAIIAYNDAEISGLTPGEQIIIPNGVIGGTSGSNPSSSSANAAAFPWGGSTPVYGGSGYDFGYCTWYVATQIPSVPSNWGNADTWAYYATLSGWNVSAAPTAGSIAQTADAAGGEGHVAVVEAVNGNQIEIRDMNDYGDGGGFDHVGTGWVSSSAFQHFLTP
jgi:surface antigen